MVVPKRIGPTLGRTASPHHRGGRHGIGGGLFV